MRSFINVLLLFVCLLGSVQTVFGQSDNGNKKYDFLKSRTQVKNPLEMRDPFKRKIIRKKHQVNQEKKDSGYYSDEGSIDNVPMDKIKVVGVLLGNQRRAMVKLNEKENSEIFYLREGSKIGQNGAELKAILPGGIVLVEKIRNVYDQDEYLETVIPITAD